MTPARGGDTLLIATMPCNTWIRCVSFRHLPCLYEQCRLNAMRFGMLCIAMHGRWQCELNDHFGGVAAHDRRCSKALMWSQ